MTRRIPVVCLAAALLFLGAIRGARAQEQRAEATFPFEPWNARAVALGDAGAAASGLAFAAINPAAAAGTRSAVLSYRSSPAGLRDYGVEGGYTWHWGTLAVAVRRRDWGEVAGDLGLSDLTAGDQALALIYAGSALRERVRWGGSASRLDSDLLGSRSGGWSFDVGAQAALAGGITLGASLLHLGDDLGTDGAEAPLPSRLRGGLAWAGEFAGLRLTVAGDAAAPLAFDSRPDTHLGIAIGHTAGLLLWELRGGVQRLADRHGGGAEESAWTLGGALGLGRLRVDIATASRGALGSDLVVSFGMMW